jgi:hypothetical protein
MPFASQATRSLGRVQIAERCRWGPALPTGKSGIPRRSKQNIHTEIAKITKIWDFGFRPSLRVRAVGRELQCRVDGPKGQESIAQASA